MSRARRALWPSLGFLLFLVHLGFVLADPRRPLADPGTGWHLRWGEIMLDSGVVWGPEPFLYLLPDLRPINTAWLFDVAAAALHRLGGIPLFTAATMVVFGATLVVIYRRALEVGAHPLAAWLAAFGAYVVMLVQPSARPHQATFLGFALVVYELDRFEAGRIPARRLWWMPPAFVLWTNLHGGFAAGLAVLGIHAVAEALRWAWGADGATGRRTATLAAVLAASVLATFVNPYGAALHAQIVEFLTQESTAMFSEFQSPQFHGGNVFESVLRLGIVGVVFLLGCGMRALPLAGGLVLAYFLGQALLAVRHAGLFAIAAAPTAALLVTDAARRLAPRWAARGDALRASEIAARGDRVLVPVAAAAFLVASVVAQGWFARDLLGLRVSAGAAEYIRAHRAELGRIFNGEDTGGTLAYLFWPDLKIYIDDRLNGYGDRFFREQYLPIVRLEPEWQAILDRNGVTSAVMSPRARYAVLWRESPAWREVYADDTTVIYVRRSPPPARS